MNFTPLTALSPLDGRYQQRTRELSHIFSEYGLIKHRVIVEIRWLEALTDEPLISEIPPLSSDIQVLLDNLISSFDTQAAERVKQIESHINHDVKAVEYYLKEKFSAEPLLAPYKEFIHFACTSEDVNNLSYALMLKAAREAILIPKLEVIHQQLENFSREHADVAMLARTHGQAASPTTMGKEFKVFSRRLSRQLEQLASIKILGKCNGAVGNFNAHHCTYPKVNWINLSKNFIEKLGLVYNPLTTQIEPHDFIAELAHNFIRINNILCDLSQDCWGYLSQGYLTQVVKQQEVGSSTMPHKVNPIDFENCEGNLGLANSLLNYFADKLPISRYQRDLSDSTVLRNLGVALGYSQLAYNSLSKGLNKIQPNHEKLTAELNNNWEILAEALQTTMRRYGIPQPYEQLKSLTRGQKINQAILHDFIDHLDLPDPVKNNLKDLKPENYLGLAKLLITHQDPPLQTI